ncbi:MULTISPECIES: NAD(P)H-dependent glycerol-3-phosphate dehydrogenase [Dialister]|uniref:Glycerol-3-phosphate dehydrogenase [NAD(P)+] n=1 Tax=Dialister hominis TaxID=2582419 RepID=A0A8D4UTU4_9FIRM|nr:MULTISPECIES: NAD(P)H-dependent glycerol-3-phosphate dehydrogenase [Dialister]UYJ16683.1 MAG: NAD(P)-dependent glycerol-3-phosphate dehydrogenase [Veillonellaceae bacterium]MBP6059935.1 NAD(P)-dependent glycerol-3-phosphate dehydrogenase [Dialister sp.]MBS6412659.1 NAD(P)-dependent glycerol-3-phosphate dehydrogenase [Dialister sp.]MEE1348610.1 NAD(P)H-dependent glycerol-3-phosphate dehydrogenase [Dialister hominis]CDD80822.1 glycerol-3-phosphate dehydrogenase [NAD(P)+] [Dialister sp. CAG:35
MKIAMIGAGGWGTAMMISLAGRHKDLVLYCRKPETAEKLNRERENKEYLPGVHLPEVIRITSDLKEAVEGAGCVVICTPSKAVADTAGKIAKWLEKDAVVVSASKGLADDEGHRLSEVIAQKVAGITDRIVALSGPNHAEEVGAGLPCATVAASEVPEAVQIVQDLFMSPVFRVYRSDDIRGVEYGGALKNIMALACGVLDGIKLGDNSRAALMTRGLVEMTRFGVRFGAKMNTFFGLSGMGDLVVTCTSSHSRNHTAGVMMGEGKTAKEIVEGTNMVVEGMRTALLVHEIAKREHIDMPITEEVCCLINGEHTARKALEVLMARAKKAESETYPTESL